MSKVGRLGWGVGKTDIMGGDALFHTILANFTTIAIPKKKQEDIPEDKRHTNY